MPSDFKGDPVVVVLSWRRGLFRTMGKGDLFGAFGAQQLEDLVHENREHHPLHKSIAQLAIAVPMLAFVDKSFTEQHRLASAGVLFGEDFLTIADMIETLERPRNRPKSLLGRHAVRERLDILYLVYLAPGLLFLGTTAYAALGIDPEVGRQIARDLYITETSAGRLPNEFYMLAVKDHLDLHLPLAARVAARVSATGGRPRLPDERTRGGLVLRGLVERALEQRARGGIAWLATGREPAFDNMLEEYRARGYSYLLRLELLGIRGEAVGPAPDGEELTPGLAAAVGWMMLRFYSRPADIGICRQIFTEIRTLFYALLARYVQSPGGLGLPWNTVATFFSTFLQWAVQWPAQTGPVLLGDVAALVNSPEADHHSARLHLQIILADGLIWATLEQRIPIADVPAVADALSWLSNGNSGPSAVRADEQKLLANRFFSLVWHNQWMSVEESQFSPHAAHPDTARALRTRAEEWLNRHEAEVLSIVAQEPAVLDVSLQYTWCHSVTQYAVWMRSWCFLPDPETAERNRITRGSDRHGNNSALMSMAEAIVAKAAADDTSYPWRLRNVFFLLGTRATRLPRERFAQWLRVVESQLAEEREDIKVRILQSVLELARLGYLPNQSAEYSGVFAEWCRSQFATLTDWLPVAWREHYRELRELSHPLDLLPAELDGWRDLPGLEDVVAARTENAPQSAVLELAEATGA